MSEVDAVIKFYAVHYHHYADDFMIYLSLPIKAFGDLSSVVSSSDAVSSWFLQNALLLNPGKTEAVIFGTCQRLSTLIKPVGVRVAGSTVTFADAVKLLGVSLHSTLTFNQHITVVCACTYHTRVAAHQTTTYSCCEDECLCHCRR